MKGKERKRKLKQLKKEKELQGNPLFAKPSCSRIPYNQDPTFWIVGVLVMSSPF